MTVDGFDVFDGDGLYLGQPEGPDGLFLPDYPQAPGDLSS